MRFESHSRVFVLLTGIIQVNLHITGLNEKQDITKFKKLYNPNPNYE